MKNLFKPPFAVKDPALQAVINDIYKNLGELNVHPEVFKVDVANGRVEAAELRALTSAGLKLYDDAGNGLLVNDGGIISLSHTIEQQSWVAPTLLNSWANYGSPHNTAGYFRDKNGIVHLKGVVKDGAANAIFTLPTGYRPAAQELQPVQTSPNAIGRCDIKTDGTVEKNAGSTTWFSLDGITFRADGY